MHLASRRRTRLAGALILALATVLLPLAPGASATTTTTVTFEYTGTAQSWIVPAGVHAVTLEAFGASVDGIWGNCYGSGGGWAQRTLDVVPGESLVIMVGGMGSFGGYWPDLGGDGGFNGGGNGGYGRGDGRRGAGGGGASDVRQQGSSLSQRVVVAGGAGGCSYYSGGDGGGLVGQDGGHHPDTYISTHSGTGAGPVSGGAGGFHYIAPLSTVGYPGESGSFGEGGHGGDAWDHPSNDGGAGGGGGWYGGGGGVGGYAGAGGGGSGYAPGGELKTGVHEGHGLVVITYVAIGPCSGSGTRVDRVFGEQNGYDYEVDIHNTPTDVAVCTTLTSPGGATILYRELVVAKDTDPTDFLPPYDPPEVDGDAPPGDEAGTPCPVTHANHGTENARGYVRQSDASSEDTVVCVGFRLPGAERHVRVTLHEGPSI